MAKLTRFAPFGVLFALQVTASLATADAGVGAAASASEPEESEDAGPVPPPVGLTPAQTEFRQKLVDREHTMVHDLARGNGRHISTEDREMIGMHWRHVMRLLRIRELAAAANDAASVTKCDDLLVKADKWIHAKLTRTPAGGGAK
jgi:hypothetical protein